MLSAQVFLEKQRSAGRGAQKGLNKGRVSGLVPFQHQGTLGRLRQLLLFCRTSAWQTICKQTPIFSATSAQNYFAKQFLGGCSIASRSPRELRFDRRSASSGLFSPMGLFPSACPGWTWARSHFVVVIGEPAEHLFLANGEKGNAQQAQMQLWQRDFHLEIHCGSTFWCYTLLGLLTRRVWAVSCKNRLDQGQACSYRPSEEMVRLLISAAFPCWGWKHHIPFSTLVLIYK